MNGETLASFLGRLAAANQTSLDALLDILPSWFRIKTRWHDDRWQHEQLTAWADDAAACLAVVSGSTIAGIKNALPAFGGKRGQPVRAVTAGRASSERGSRRAVAGRRRGKRGSCPGLPGRWPAPGEVVGGACRGPRDARRRGAGRGGCGGAAAGRRRRGAAGASGRAPASQGRP